MTTYDISTDNARCSITVDETLCTGTGLCMVYGPDTFDMNDDLKAFARPETNEDLAAIRAAAEACPNRAISVTVN